MCRKVNIIASTVFVPLDIVHYMHCIREDYKFILTFIFRHIETYVENSSAQL